MATLDVPLNIPTDQAMRFLDRELRGSAVIEFKVYQSFLRLRYERNVPDRESCERASIIV